MIWSFVCRCDEVEKNGHVAAKDKYSNVYDAICNFGRIFERRVKI